MPLPFCPDCGTEHGSDDNFCGTCGRDLKPSAGHVTPPQAPRASSPATPATAPPRTLSLPVATGAFVAVLVAVVAVMFFTNRGGDDTPNPVPDDPAGAAIATSPPSADETGEAVGTVAALGPTDQELLANLAQPLPASNPSTTANITATLAGLNVPGAASDRAEMRSLVGPPQAFDLSFEADPQNPTGPLLRIETWYYFNLGTAFLFADGRLWNSLPLEEPGEIALLPLQYDPADFPRTLTWEQAAALIDDPDAGPVTDFETSDLGVALAVYAGPQIMLMFDPDGLAAVSTFPLTPSVE